MVSDNYQYGRNLDFPINVCGVKGELEYLKRLLTENKIPLFFHRIGSVSFNSSKPIDRYEVVSADGTFWDNLYFNIYSEINDFLIPIGYSKFSPEDRLRQFVGSLNFPNKIHFLIEESTGTNGRILNFPEEIAWRYLSRNKFSKKVVFNYFSYRRNISN